MRKNRTRSLLLIGGMAALLLLTGCFQQAGGDLDTGPIQDQPTFTPSPTNTPLVTDTPIPLETDTPRPPVSLSTVAPGGATATSELPVFVDFATATSDGLGFSVPTEVAIVSQPETQGDPFSLTATSIVQGATSTAGANLTATWAALTGFQSPTPTQPFSPFATATPPGQVGVPVSPGGTCIHEVRAEDRNLYRISLRYGLTVEQIAQASGIVNVNLITIGQRLTIPGCGTTGAIPPATSVPQVTSAPVFGATATPSTGGTFPSTGGGGQIYVVRQGDTLFEISLQYGVTVEAIAAANGIANINLIYIGQELVIP